MTLASEIYHRLFCKRPLCGEKKKKKSNVGEKLTAWATFGFGFGVLGGDCNHFPLVVRHLAVPCRLQMHMTSTD